MAIPDFQALMLPIMLLTADGAEHTLAAFGVGVTPTGLPCVLKRVDLGFFDDV